MADKRKIFRILDANFNRLREALRVIEEYYRFIEERPGVCGRLKKLRHAFGAVEEAYARKDLLAGRDTDHDCFAERNRPEELDRGGGVGALVAANFKRAEEACRVIEEYAKVSGGPSLSERAKAVRFRLYACEKELCGGEGKGKTRKRK